MRSESSKDVRTVDDEALACLMAHRWPGNVRELINALRYASVCCQGPQIRMSHLPVEVQSAVTRPEETTVDDTASRTLPIDAGSLPPLRGQARLTSEIVDQALVATGGNKVRAARHLGVGRATLYRFLRHQGDSP